ncbi:amidohydrolase family protein [Pseudoalteromonas ardens]|uniref:amidohydrolase family protein n=1 Tax=Pseudoalteromonas ardens TaxID=3048490 RepID=UPI0024C32C51|nr:amidohydrolase family protein [Pseudoalteromonas sp. R96]MDK1310106.1 amidohydrolase family protein [Pseudoalteromonas sp. R96]
MKTIIPKLTGLLGGAISMCLSAQFSYAAETQVMSSDALLLTQVQVVDVEQQEIRRSALLIEQGKIAAEYPAPPANFKGRTLNLNNRWLIPGLVDMHVHAFGNRAPHAKSDFAGTEKISQRALYAGVTGFVDLFGDEQDLIAVREKQRAGTFFGADIYSSLSCLTAPKGHCTEYGLETRTMSTPEEAVAQVQDLAKAKPDVIKVVYQPSDDQPSIDKATFAAIVQQSNKLGIKTIVHLKTWQEVLDAIDVGATAFTHMPGTPIPAGLADKIAAAKMVVIPTMTVHTDLTDFLFDKAVIASELLQAMTTPAIIAGYQSEETMKRWGDREAKWRKQDAQRTANLAELIKAGVTILNGTDAGNYGTIQGYSVHREMLKLTQAGMSNWQTLAATTTQAGTFLGIDNSLKPGAQASFVILDASPIENIQNTQKIHAVIHQGKVVDRVQALKNGF